MLVSQISKSTESQKAAPMRSLVRGACEKEIPVAYRYLNFQELERDFTKIKHPWLIVSQTEQSVLISLLKEKEIQYTISLDESFEFLIQSSNQTLPSDHFVYKKHKRNVSKYRIQWLLNDLRALTICYGIFDDEVKKYGMESYNKRLIVLSIRDQGKTFNKVYSKNCHLVGKLNFRA